MLLLATLLLYSFFLDTPHQRGNQEAVKVDSYDDKIPGSEAEQWHLEELREKLLKDPGATVHIIAYGGREDNPGKARRYALRAKNWLVEMRGVEARRIVAIDGGRREKFIVELWLVPINARPPRPTPTVEMRADLSDNLLYDEFGIGYDNFGNRAEDATARLDGFAAMLKSEPASWGCVVTYAQAGDDRVGVEWDPPGTALKTAQSQKQYLIRKHGFADSKLTAVDAGYAGRFVQLWIMRPNAKFDEGPFIYSSRLKAQRNGTLTIQPRSSSLCCDACKRGSGSRRTLRNGRPKPE